MPDGRVAAKHVVHGELDIGFLNLAKPGSPMGKLVNLFLRG